MAGGDATRLTGGADVLVAGTVVEVDVVEVDVDDVEAAVRRGAGFFVEVVRSAAGPGAGCVVLDMKPGRVPVPATALVVVVEGTVVEVDVELLVVVGSVPGTVPGGGYEGTLELVVEVPGTVVVVVDVGAEVDVVGRVVVVTGTVVVVVLLVGGTLDEVVLAPGGTVVVVVGRVVVVVVPAGPITFAPEVEVLSWAARGSRPVAPAGAMPVRKSTDATQKSIRPAAVQARRTLDWDIAGVLPAAFRAEDIRAPTSVRGGRQRPGPPAEKIIAPGARNPPGLPAGHTSYQGACRRLPGPTAAAGAPARPRSRRPPARVAPARFATAAVGADTVRTVGRVARRVARRWPA